MARHRQHRPEAARCARRGVPLLLLFRVRRSGRVQVVLDVGGAEGPMAGGLLRCVSVLSPNETELHRMTGAATGTRAEVVLAARALQQQGAHDVLVKLGSKGSLLVAGTLPPPHTSPGTPVATAFPRMPTRAVRPVCGWSARVAGVATRARPCIRVRFEAGTPRRGQRRSRGLWRRLHDTCAACVARAVRAAALSGFTDAPAGVGACV